METVQLDFLGDLRRTNTCGELRAADTGKRALLMGWVHRRRDLGGVIFIHLRDRDGVTQLVFHADAGAEVFRKAETLGSEYVIAVEGAVARRTAETVNAALPTGEVELVVERLWILNESRTPPFPMEETVDVKEAARLKYRYVDLRRPHMQGNVILRSKISFAVSEFLYGQGFLEIETPFMTRSTPEGARDYLVPSRVQPGTFYALPQSPQLFKQILMISGCDKYFQIVRCFRDEDLRADRQPEFTQIDLEMSYPQPERVWEGVEGFLTAAFAAAGSTIRTPFARMDYDEAIRLYGIDKPDLRLPPFVDVKDCFAAENLQQLALNTNLAVVAIPIPKVGGLSRAERDPIKPLFISKGGARVYEDFKRIGNKFPDAAAAIAKKTAMEAGDWSSFSLDRRKPGNRRRFRRIVKSHRRNWRFMLRLACCAWHWRRSTPSVTAFSKRPAIRRRTFDSCGSRIFRCSSGTKARRVGWPRIIRLRRRTKKTCPSWRRAWSRCTIRSRS